MKALGFVSIVGAGPGDPDLLTRRAIRRLRQADLVLYDGLVPHAIVRLAREARHRLVSRRPGGQRLAPAAVVRLLVDAARRGQQVVRLRAGDPFVLARGAEEALGLVAAGVPFEVVPGLSSASAAPTLAGIPLTHRGVASGFVVISGHGPEAYAPVLGALPPDSATVVALMGLAERSGIARLLLERGWRPVTPVAILTNASRPGARAWRARLQELGDDIPGLSTTTPGVIVIGEVVGLGAAIAAAIHAAPARRLTPPRRPARQEANIQEASWQR